MHTFSFLENYIAQGSIIAACNTLAPCDKQRYDCRRANGGVESLHDDLEGGIMGWKIFPILVLMLAISACNSPQPTQAETVSPPPPVTLTVYFTDMARFQAGTEPYEAAVTRTVPAPASLPEAVLTQLFLGPTEVELLGGLEVVKSGATGFSKLTIDNGIARVYLTGACASNGSTYTIANLIFGNLKQFPEIKWIKIFDPNGETETPEGQSSSIPFCLEP
jgi:hypothetical protein